MINASDTLQTYSLELLCSLQHLQENPQIFDNIVSLDFACDKLATFEQGAHAVPESSKIFEVLHNNGLNGSPAVYWFEITSDHNAIQIRQSFAKLKESIGARKTPAVYKEFDQSSKILYVGKGNENISGRMFLHLGYEPKHTHLQGLQLCHWDYLGDLKGLCLRLNIIYLPLDMKVLAPVFEYKLAKTLNPILGKHR